MLSESADVESVEAMDGVGALWITLFLGKTLTFKARNCTLHFLNFLGSNFSTGTVFVLSTP